MLQSQVRDREGLKTYEIGCADGKTSRSRQEQAVRQAVQNERSRGIRVVGLIIRFRSPIKLFKPNGDT